MSIEDIIHRLREDRQIAERERRQARIEASFAEARTVERRRYVHPGEINPESLGRQKDDPRPNPPKLRPALSSLAKPILDDAVKAAPLVYHRRPDVSVYDLGDAPEVSDAELPKLLESCEEALGFKKPVAERSCLMGELEEPSIWKRDIFRMVKGSR
jgi:CTP:molybdopterin cytidylyltransferase MocA